jgi:hypothetical protein
VGQKADVADVDEAQTLQQARNVFASEGADLSENALAYSIRTEARQGIHSAKEAGGDLS